MTGTYIWTAIFLIAAAMFWGVAFWAVVRGGRDVIDIITQEKSTSPR